jgi:pimeloyl-ACP methyl ester carboxylesterase
MADTAVDLAHGLGDRVYVLGLSSGGGIAAWVAQYRGDVERVVVVAPFFGAIGLPSGLDQWGTNLITRLPNIPFPFSTPVPYQYLGMSSLGIGESMRFSSIPSKQSSKEPIRAGSVVLVTNENDNTISNPLARKVLAQWEEHGSKAEEFVIEKKYGLPHDVIDTHQNGSDPELIYPIMIDLIEGRIPIMP